MQEQDSIHAVVALTDDDFIKSRIFTIRDVQVILSSDLAPLYDVEVKYLHRQVRRNENRFPSDFVLHLTPEEANALRCQNVTSKRGGDRYGVLAFTEQGVAILPGQQIFFVRSRRQAAALPTIGKSFHASMTMILDVVCLYGSTRGFKNFQKVFGRVSEGVVDLCRTTEKQHETIHIADHVRRAVPSR